MEGSKEEKPDKKEKEKPKESREKRKRSESPYASKDDIKSKNIELIVYVGNLPITWN